MADINGLVQERRNSGALAMELRLSGSNPSIWCFDYKLHIFVNHVFHSFLLQHFMSFLHEAIDMVFLIMNYIFLSIMFFIAFNFKTLIF